MTLLAEAFVQKYRLPLRVYFAHSARSRMEAVSDALGDDAFVRQLAAKSPPPEPGAAIVVIAPRDLEDSSREFLLEVVTHARPGRPILCGGLSHRDVLLDAINKWRIGRAIPEDTNPAILIDAIRKGHEQTQTEVAIHRAAVDLRMETEKLEKALGDLKKKQNQLLHAERVATVGRAAIGLITVLHDHLASLVTFEQMLQPVAKELGVEKYLGYTSEGIRATQSLLEEIRGYTIGQADGYSFATEDLDVLVQSAVDFGRFDPLADERKVRIGTGSSAKVSADRHRLSQVLLNLLRNAFQATDPGGNIVVRTGRDRDLAFIEVQDDGVGMTEDVRRKAFEPFFSTKGEEGVGLGLRMCRNIVERHGGSIDCTSEPGDGSCFKITLPMMGD